MASAVEVVLVPGYWVGPGAYDTVKPLLEQADHRVTVAPLPSTGQLPGPTNNLQADVAAIRAIIESRVEQGADVLVVAHSAGGFLAAHATQDLGKKARADAGKKGGVVKFAFLAGALFPPGHVHGPAPFMDIQVRLFLIRIESIIPTHVGTPGRQAMVQGLAAHAVQRPPRCAG